MAMNYPDFSRANCIGTDTDSFFPESGLDSELMAAKRTCGRCEIMDVCLEWALHHEDSGLWGGLTAEERRAVRYKRGIVLETPHLAVTGAA